MKKLFLSFSLIWGLCSAQAATHAVALNWGASTSTGVLGYNVYRGLVSGGPYTKVGSVGPTSVSFTDQTPVVGTAYFYVVTAFGAPCVAGATVPCGESAFSPEASPGVIPPTFAVPGTIMLIIR